jgi:hypothetical protein
MTVEKSANAPSSSSSRVSAGASGHHVKSRGRARSLWIATAALTGLTIAAAGAALYLRHRNQTAAASGGTTAALARAGGDETLTFLVGAVADIDVRPASLAPGGTPATAAAFWVKGPEALPWTAKIDVAADGTVHLRGTIDAPFGGIEDDLAVVVTPAGRPPATPDQCKPPCEVIHRKVRYVRSIVPAPLPGAPAR